jgi:hypothetical protein
VTSKGSPQEVEGHHAKSTAFPQGAFLGIHPALKAFKPKSSPAHFYDGLYGKHSLVSALVSERQAP